MYSWVLGRRVNVGFSGMIVNEKFYYLSNENYIIVGFVVGVFVFAVVFFLILDYLLHYIHL